MRESLLVGSKTRAALKAHGVNVGAGALELLNEVVHWYIDQAAKRAAANRRKTVFAHDFIIMEEEAAAEAPAPAAPQEAEADTGYGGSGYTESATPDAGEAVEEAAEEEAAEEAPSPPTWSS